MTPLSHALKLCLVIGPSHAHPRELFSVIDAAIAGGVTSIQLRDKEASESTIFSLGKKLLTHLPCHIPLIINDHVDVAHSLQTALHIGQSDTDYLLARKIMGEKACIGLSINHLAEADTFQECDASYFGVGPVFSTPSKPDATPPLGIDGLLPILRLLQPKPCVAIGGIHLSNIALLRHTGITGVAVISAITAAHSPYDAARQLKEAF